MHTRWKSQQTRAPGSSNSTRTPGQPGHRQATPREQPPRWGTSRAEEGDMIFKRQPKDPSERVRAALDVLAQQHRENNQRGIGLMNMPKHQRAKQDLVRMGSEAVPPLVRTLSTPRASTDT